jgi:PAS domain S-box-containing protein
MWRISNTKPWAYAAVAMLLILGVEQIFELREKRGLQQEERAHVVGELSDLRQRLLNVINGNLLAIRGLVAVISAQPDIDQVLFERIARGLVGEDSALRNIAGAPDLVVSLMHPMEGNEAALGLDYRKNPIQRDDAMRAIDSRSPVLAGPLTLVQGGEAFIIRAPVFLLESMDLAEPELWGLIAAVMDLERLYELVGMPADGRAGGLQLALRKTDADVAVFFGSARVFVQQPVVVDVSVPGGIWQLAGAPSAGWGSLVPSQRLNLVRVVGLVLAVIVGVMVYALTRRNQQLRRLSADLQESQSLFTAFMANLPAGAFVRDPESGMTIFENRWLSDRRSVVGQRWDDALPDHADVIDDEPQMRRDSLMTEGGDTQFYDTLRFRIPAAGGRSMTGGIVMDVTEQEVAQASLSASRARLRALFDTIPDLVWMKDPDGVYLACNRRFEQFFGAAEAAIAGSRDSDFVDRELAECLRENDRAAIATGQPSTAEETVTFAGDGHTERLEITNAAVHDERGCLIGVLGVARDITEREQMHRDLRDRLDELTRWQSVVLGREDRILELKNEVNLLLAEHGDEARYMTAERSE